MSYHIQNSGIIFPGTRISEITAVRSRADVNYTSIQFSSAGAYVSGISVGTATAYAITFTIPATSVAEVAVYVERKKLIVGVDYVITPTTLTFTVAPRPNQIIKIISIPATNSLGMKALSVLEGQNAKQGTIVLSGTSATTDVLNTSVTANSRIIVCGQQDGTGTEGFLRVVARVPGVKFTILSSSANDNSTVAYEIFEPA